MLNLPQLANSVNARILRLLSLKFPDHRLRHIIYFSITFVLMVYLSIYVLIAWHAYHLPDNSMPQKTDAALILGYRTYLNKKLNPCLTGRVDKGLSLAKQGVVSTLVMSGGHDGKNNAIEAEVMSAYARSKGFGGEILLESKSSSTLENLKFSAPILQAASIKHIIIVSEPYHLWRVEKLVTAGHLNRDLKVSYSGAPSECWTTWGVLSRGALREPFAVIHNYANGYFN